MEMCFSHTRASTAVVVLFVCVQASAEGMVRRYTASYQADAHPPQRSRLFVQTRERARKAFPVFVAPVLPSISTHPVCVPPNACDVHSTANRCTAFPQRTLRGDSGEVDFQPPRSQFTSIHVDQFGPNWKLNTHSDFQLYIS